MLPATKEELRGFASELRAEFLTEDLLYMPAISPKDLRSVATPTLLMGGALSTPLFGAILDVLNTNLPNSTRVLIPKAGHMVHLQNADEFERSVRKFLQELDGHCT
jgi:pimeloyl-ACP methyl ester carboxylesterase